MLIDKDQTLKVIEDVMTPNDVWVRLEDAMAVVRNEKTSEYESSPMPGFGGWVDLDASTFASRVMRRMNQIQHRTSFPSVKQEIDKLQTVDPDHVQRHGPSDIESLYPVKLICLVRHGAHLYGTNTEKSDLDFKGVFIPDRNASLLGLVDNEIRINTSAQHQKNTKNDIDEVYYSIGKFMDMVYKGDHATFDMLHAEGDNLLLTSPVWDYLVSNRQSFYPSFILESKSYLNKRMKKYGISGTSVGVLKEIIDSMEGFQASTTIGSLGLHEFAEKYPDYCSIKETENQTFLNVMGTKLELNLRGDAAYDILKLKLKKMGGEGGDDGDIKWKDLHHALRYILVIRGIIVTPNINVYPMSGKWVDVLKRIKLGEEPLETTKVMIEEQYTIYTDLLKEYGAKNKHLPKPEFLSIFSRAMDLE